MFLIKIDKIIICSIIYDITKYNYREFSTYWICNNDNVIIKPYFNDDVIKLNLSIGIKIIMFTKFTLLEQIKKILTISSTKNM